MSHSKITILSLASYCYFLMEYDDFPESRHISGGSRHITGRSRRLILLHLACHTATIRDAASIRINTVCCNYDVTYVVIALKFRAFTEHF